MIPLHGFSSTGRMPLVSTTSQQSICTLLHTLPGCFLTIMEVRLIFGGFGLLIKESRSFAFNVSNELLKLGQWMQDDEPTAQDALATIMKYKHDLG